MGAGFAEGQQMMAVPPHHSIMSIEASSLVNPPRSCISVWSGSAELLAPGTPFADDAVGEHQHPISGLNAKWLTCGTAPPGPTGSVVGLARARELVLQPH